MSSVNSTRLDFARRPFRDERPVFLLTGTALLAASVLFVANFRLYADFHREMDGTKRQIDSLEQRRAKVTRDAEEARGALNSYKVSTLAQESRGLLKIAAERRFSWTGLLVRLEHTLPAEVRVTRLTPRFEESGETVLDLSLIGRGPDSVVHAITAFARDPVFGSVELRSEASPEHGIPEGYSFELFLRYRAGEKAEGLAAAGKTPR